jgi:heme exporter protein B
VLRALILRDLRRAWGSGSVLWPVAFFLLVATLFPFAIGPDGALLARVGGGVVWTAALLAALLPVERLVAPDLEAGVIDQLLVREVPLVLVAAAKLVAHWLGFALPLMLAAPVAAALFGMSADVLLRVELGLLIGTPGLAALGVATGALVAGLRGAGAVAGLVMLPLAVPLLIFGGGMVAMNLGGGAGAVKLLAATSLLLCAGAPFVAAAAIRAGMD